MKRRGFTLIELLTTIVILAVIILISAPIILNTIEKANRGAFLDSVESYAHAIKNKYSIGYIENSTITTDFIIIDGKVNGEYIVTNEKLSYRGIVNFNLGGRYFLVLTDGKYCAYKNYSDSRPEIVDNENCNIDLSSGIYEPIIEIENENKITSTKRITINYLNNINTNQYCIFESTTSTIEDCDNWINVDGSMTTFKIDKESTIYAKTFNDEEELISSKIVSNIGEETIDKTPIINSLSLTAGLDYITATVTATPYSGNKIVKYYYSIDGRDYIESEKQYYVFENLENYIKHTIKVYVEDNEGNISKVSTDSLKTLYEDTSPVINSLTLSRSQNDISVIVSYKVAKGRSADIFYYKIDNGDYIESEDIMYTFSDLEPYVEHVIEVYFEDSEGEESNTKEISGKTLYEDKNPKVLSLSTSSGQDTIVAVATAESYGGSTIVKYYYSIDGNAYEELEEGRKSYTNVQAFEEHTIKVYVEDDNGRTSDEVSVKTSTKRKHKSPTIDSLSTTSGENDITVLAGTTTHDGATISKYYYSIDNGEYRESTSNYYNFSNLTSNNDHLFKVYVVDSMGATSTVKSIRAVTNAAVPYLTIVINSNGYEYNGEMWYPYGTSITLNYSPDMTGLTGYYQRVNESSEKEYDWSSNSSNKKKNVTLYESHTYRIKLKKSDGTESEIVEQKINIMPNPNIGGGVQENYYKYNMYGIYPVYIASEENATTSTIYGTDKYRDSGHITKTASHMGLVEYNGSKTIESKLVYIKLIPCPSGGYKGSTRNGITSSDDDYSGTKNGYVFVTEDGTEIKGPTASMTTSADKTSITATLTAESYNEATIKKYYFKIDKEGFIESDKPYYTFKNVTPYIIHTITGYAEDSNGISSSEVSVDTKTTLVLPKPQIKVNESGIEYNGEMWYPKGTKMTISYSDDMSNIKGYYMYKNESSETESQWYSNSTRTIYTRTLTESMTYKAKITDKTGTVSEIAEMKINIMPNPNISSGIQTNYYKYNMGGIYPIYIGYGTSLSTSTIYGEDEYRSTSRITKAAAHMGLIKNNGQKTTESKTLYIKLTSCPSGGYKESTRNGIKSSSVACSSSYNGYIFVTEDGTEIKGPSIGSLTTSIGDNNITATLTAESYNGSTIKKYYYKIDNGGYIESDKPYYTFNASPYTSHTIITYIEDSNGFISSEKSVTTTAILAPPKITVDTTGIEYKGEMWYPSGTKVTITYASNMQSRKYQRTNLSSKEVNSGSYSSTTYTPTALKESYLYEAYQIDKDGKESQHVKMKINIMPAPASTAGIPTNYYTYNMGGIYPIRIYYGVETASNTPNGVNKYVKTTFILKAAAQMGLIKSSGTSKVMSLETKVLYIKLIPCPSGGYVSGTKNGIKSNAKSCSSTVAQTYGYVFVTEDGKEITQ